MDDNTATMAKHLAPLYETAGAMMTDICDKGGEFADAAEMREHITAHLQELDSSIRAINRAVKNISDKM